MKKLMLACAVVAIVALSATQVLAFSFAYNYVGDVLIKYDNFEQYVPGYTAAPDLIGFGVGGTNYFANVPTGGQDLYGILKLKTIAPIGGGPNLWWDGKDNEEITGYFKDLRVTNFVATAILGDDDVLYSIMFGAVGGTTPTIFSFLDTPGDLNVDGPSAGIPGAPLIPGSAVDGVSFLDIQFIPGIIVGDPVTLINSTYSTISDPNNGTGFFLGKIVGGNYTNIFPLNSTVSGQSNINVPPNPLITQNWNTTSFDPLTATVVPEPATMLLLGSGLIGLARYTRRKMKK